MKLNFKERKQQNKGITLIALIITIIILLILAGISISALTNQGLFGKAKDAEDRTIKAQLKEEIDLAIQEIQIEEIPKGNNVTLETLSNGQLQSKLTGITATLENNEITGEYKSYYYKIDSNLNVSIEGEVKGIRVSYTLNPEGYTKENVKISIAASSANGKIADIKAPSELVKNEDETYTVTKNGNYEFIITDNVGNSRNFSVKINTIDKLKPENFTPTITESGTSSLTVKSNAQDAQANEENAKSGIEKYEYFIKAKTENEYTKYESFEDTYIFKKLESGVEYDIYVIAYDKADNSKISEVITETTKIGPKDIYIDSINGSDEIGDGTEEKPYATLSKITETGIIKTGLTYNIYLRDGEYTIPTYGGLISLSNDKEINIFGNKKDTKLKVPSEGVGWNAGGGGTDTYSINFYRMIIEIEDSTTRSNYWCCANNLTFNNVVFLNNMTHGLNGIFYINKATSTVLLNNCTFIENDFKLRCDNGSIKAINCYGNLKSGTGTSENDWNYQTNYITESYQVNSTTYRITDIESLWKNIGTGVNPDGSQANLGVYGGIYSWEN